MFLNLTSFYSSCFSLLSTRFWRISWQVISCLTISLLQNKYLGYACIALSVELSNIFLHLRQLLNICQYPKDSSLYLLNRWVNLIAFVLFRGSVQVFLTSKMLQHKDSVPGSVFFIASLCVMTVSVITIVLFYRLLQSEFGSKDTDSFSSSFNQRKTIKNQSEAIKPNNGVAKCKHSLHDFDQSNGTLVFDENKAKWNEMQSSCWRIFFLTTRLTNSKKCKINSCNEWHKKRDTQISFQ